MLGLVAVSSVTEAVAAIHGSLASRLERYSGSYAALATGGFVHRAIRCSFLLLARLTARRASLGIVFETLFTIEFLLRNSKGKL